MGDIKGVGEIMAIFPCVRCGKLCSTVWNKLSLCTKCWEEILDFILRLEQEMKGVKEE